MKKKKEILINRHGEILGTPPELYKHTNTKNDIDHGNVDQSKKNGKNNLLSTNIDDGIGMDETVNDNITSDGIVIDEKYRDDIGDDVVRDEKYRDDIMSDVGRDGRFKDDIMSDVGRDGRFKDDIMSNGLIQDNSYTERDGKFEDNITEDGFIQDNNFNTRRDSRHMDGITNDRLAQIESYNIDHTYESNSRHKGNILGSDQNTTTTISYNYSMDDIVTSADDNTCQIRLTNAQIPIQNTNCEYDDSNKENLNCSIYTEEGMNEMDQKKYFDEAHNNVDFNDKNKSYGNTNLQSSYSTSNFDTQQKFDIRNNRHDNYQKDYSNDFETNHSNLKDYDTSHNIYNTNQDESNFEKHTLNNGRYDDTQYDHSNDYDTTYQNNRFITNNKGGYNGIDIQDQRIPHQFPNNQHKRGGPYEPEYDNTDYDLTQHPDGEYVTDGYSRSEYKMYENEEYKSNEPNMVEYGNNDYSFNSFNSNEYVKPFNQVYDNQAKMEDQRIKGSSYNELYDTTDQYTPYNQHFESKPFDQQFETKDLDDTLMRKPKTKFDNDDPYVYSYYDKGDQPLYVNVKQFHCIRKRKMRRDFLDTLMKQQNSGYLHESRHRHAMNRMRAPSGRFLTKEETAKMKNNQKEEK